jgi:hypothetical protein
MGFVADALDAGAGLLDELDAMQQVGDQGIAPDALRSEVGERHPLGQEEQKGELLDVVLI